MPELSYKRKAPKEGAVAEQSKAPQSRGVSNSEMLRMSGAGPLTRMSPALREKFEPGFSADFSNIRISRGYIPEEMGVQAVARGTDILLDQSAGMDVLGHELAHVVQQATGRVQKGGYPVVENAALEREADVQGARVAAGGSVETGMGGIGGEALSIAPMSGATAPAQCKSREEKRAEKAARRAQAQPPTPVATQPPTPTAATQEQQAQAQAILDAGDADTKMKSRNFDDAAARYNATQTDSSRHLIKDNGDTKRQRFLQRHLTGSVEEQDALVRSVMENGDAGMLPILREEARRIMAWDPSHADTSNPDALLQHGADTLTLNKDTHNFNDMTKVDAQGVQRISAQDLGLNEEEFALFTRKKRELFEGAAMTQRGLRGMANGQMPGAQMGTDPTFASATAPTPAGQNRRKPWWKFWG